MQSVPRKIFQILDGTPAVYGQYSRGQSLAELALVTPLLIVLLMGLAEIGWFANNYLILLETTRVGARYGAVQRDDQSPYSWDNAGSLLPILQPDYLLNGDATQNARVIRMCDNGQPIGAARFYNVILCKMYEAMSPLSFRGKYLVPGSDPADSNGVDDIVISAFSLQSINPTDTNIPSGMRSKIALVPSVPSTQQQVLVVGRYPTNANECTTEPLSVTDRDTRDPFDYIDYKLAGNTDFGSTDSYRNYIMSGGTQLWSELLGYDSGIELQRGFAVTGQHLISSTRANLVGTRCYGSEWTIARVQNLINVTGFSMNQDQRARLPNEGLILVEMFWQHTLLLRNPVFNPVFNILNDPGNPNGGGTIISVWAAFPLPTTEPRIKYAVGS